MQFDPVWVALLIKLGALATALGAIYKWMWLPFKEKVLDRINDFYNKVNYITSELKPNGGNSLRDQINAIRAMVVKIDKRQVSFFHFDPHGIVETDATGNLVWANRAYLDLVRRHPEEVIQQGWRNVIHEDDRERIIREWMHAVADGRDFYSKFRIRSSLGETVNVEARCLAMRDEENRLTGHLGFVYGKGEMEAAMLPTRTPGKDQLSDMK